MLSKDRAAAAVADLFGTAISPGTVAALAERAAEALGRFRELVRARIAGAAVAHFDETGLRVAGKLRWVHSISTPDYSLITCHDKRGVAAMDDAGVLPQFTGVAVHDASGPTPTPATRYVTRTRCASCRPASTLTKTTPSPTSAGRPN